MLVAAAAARRELVAAAARRELVAVMGYEGGGAAGVASPAMEMTGCYFRG